MFFPFIYLAGQVSNHMPVSPWYDQYSATSLDLRYCSRMKMSIPSLSQSSLLTAWALHEPRRRKQQSSRQRGDTLWRSQPVLKVEQNHLKIRHKGLCQILRRKPQTIMCQIQHQGSKHLRRYHGMCLTSRRRTTSLVQLAELEQMLAILLDLQMMLFHSSRNWLRPLLQTIYQPIEKSRGIASIL